MNGGRHGAPRTDPGDARAAVLFASLTTRLLRAGPDLDRGIHDALAEIGRFARADRAYLLRLRDNDTVEKTHEWLAEGATSAGDVAHLPLARLAPAYREAEGPVTIASVADLPEAAPHRAHLTRLGIRSLVVAPLIDRGRRIGFVGFATMQETRSFDPAEVTVLTAFAELLTTVILRAEAEARAEASRRDLARAEARLRTTLSALPDAVLDLDGTGRIVVAHSRQPDLLAVPAETLIGAGLDAALPPPLAEACRRCLAALAEGQDRASDLVECAALGPGAERCIRITAAPHEAGSTGGAVVLLRDATEDRRRQAEREMLEQVARRTDNLVVVTDADRRITWVNEAFERLTGWTLAEARGQNPAELTQFEGTDPDEILRIRAALDRGDPIKAELLNRSRCGATYWVELDIQPIRNDEGRITGFLSVQTDISQRKASADEMVNAALGATQAHQRLRDAIESLPDAFAFFDADDRLALCNDRYRAVTRVPGVDDIVGLRFEDLIRSVALTRAAAGDIAETEAWVQTRIATHRTPGEPYLLRLLDGRWVKVHEKRTPGGGCVTMLVDVTAEREATQRLEDTLDAARAGTWEWRLDDGDRLNVDDRIAQMLGHDRAADLGPLTIADWRARMHPDDRAAIGDGWEVLRSDSENVSDHVYRVRHRDGHYTWVLSRGRMAQRNGRCRIGVIIDISQRKRLEAELEAERDYLETLMETSMSAIIALDGDGMIVYCNREAERLFDLPADRIEGSAFESDSWQVTRLDGTPMGTADMPFVLVRDSGRALRDQRLALRRPDGRRQLLSINAAPVERPGNPVRVVCAIRDITAETEAEAALHAALAGARDATEAKSRFLASMSHEIRTPLNGVLGMAELLELALTEPRHREMVTVIRESGALLLSVLNDILDMSKIEAGKLELEVAPFAPEALVSAVEALHTVAARRRGIDLVVWSGVGLDRPRLGDMHRIQQILHNLVGNAIKFTETGEVAVTLAMKPGDLLSIRVRDTGPGMTAEQLSRVFEEFEQADGTVARRYGGSGLGLAIVHRLVDLMGGRIEVDSAPGKGTDVRVTLPLPPAPAEPVVATGRDTSAAEAPVALAGLRALVAEDNATNRMILKAMLDRLGIEATMVPDGTDAVAAWAPGRFDLLLLDIAMPMMGGVEALAALRAAMAQSQAGRLPAVAITANAMTHQIADYFAAGFDAHLSKPLSLAALEATLLRVTDRGGADTRPA